MHVLMLWLLICKSIQLQEFEKESISKKITIINTLINHYKKLKVYSRFLQILLYIENEYSTILSFLKELPDQSGNFTHMNSQDFNDLDFEDSSTIDDEIPEDIIDALDYFAEEEEG